VTSNRSNKLEIELNPKEQRLYDRLRSQLVEPGPKPSSGIGDMALLLPDLTILLGRLMRDERVPIFDKGLAIAGLAYVVSPLDLLPSLLLGPVGLLDDLFIVAACLSRLLNHVHPDVVRSHWSGQGDVLEVIQSVTDWFEKELSMRVSDLGKMLFGRSTR
jgi:uncharacterized membrane protein YkvA (DUF1232 family)